MGGRGCTPLKENGGGGPRGEAVATAEVGVVCSDGEGAGAAAGVSGAAGSIETAKRRVGKEAMMSKLQTISNGIVNNALQFVCDLGIHVQRTGDDLLDNIVHFERPVLHVIKGNLGLNRRFAFSRKTRSNGAPI